MLTHKSYDRFIPLRQQQTHTHFHSSSQYNTVESIYQSFIKNNILSGSRVLLFNQNNDPNCCHTNLANLSTQDSYVTLEDQTDKKIINSQPEKILDAPYIRDDFYLNNIDWNKNGVLGIALQNQVYLYHSQNVKQLCKSGDNSYVCSVKFYEQAIAIGYSDARVQIYDLEKNALVRQLKQHEKRVSSLQFSHEGDILYTGSKDKKIFAHDLKSKHPIISKLEGHRGEICSLKLEPSGTNLASGSNDNNVCIWDTRNFRFRVKFAEHKGAVKALAWCPWKSGVMASAGGSGDRTIKIWSVRDSQLNTICSQKTSTQISSLLWNKKSGALLSSHGSPENNMTAWQLTSGQNSLFQLKKTDNVNGHKSRILQIVQSPEQDMVCSYSSDETIRIWKIQQNPLTNSRFNYRQDFSSQLSCKLK